MGDERVVEIEVRSLTGESIRVCLEANKTVQQLKLLILKQNNTSSFSSNPNFHLFLKGVKLNLKHAIGSYVSGEKKKEEEEFLVIVPFAKKDKQQQQQMHTTTQTSSFNTTQKSVADSAWSDMMQDLSSLSNQPHLLQVNQNIPHTSSRTKQNKALREKEPPVDILSSILDETHGKYIFEENNLKKFIDFIHSSSCLIDPSTGSCVMREANVSDPCTTKTTFCLCPLWLKDMMRAFSFVNVYSACLQLWQKKITLNDLEEKLRKFGFRPCIPELQHLSQICPQVMRIVDDEVEARQCLDVLVILNFSAEKDVKQTAAKRLPRSKIVNSMKKREDSLKAVLSRAVKSLMRKNDYKIITSLSLEDLSYMKKANTSATETEAKRDRRRYSDSAGSTLSSYEVHCHKEELLTALADCFKNGLIDELRMGLEKPCHQILDTSSFLPEEMVGHLKSTIGSRGQMVHIEEIRARKAKYVQIPSQLSDTVKSALNRVGITRLYSHQSESIQASLAGKNVTVATMTSSGKSLCYNVPVLEVLSQNPLACALYLFPTKALAQDQYRALSAMAHGIDESINIGIYDGDTSQEDRIWLRDNARLLITNPDMLHVSILPFHSHFRRILSNLRFIIIDEAHAYKGAFGCHAALIFRRLRRICSHAYSSDPSFIFSTATSANPREHAMELANLPALELIDKDGSPSGLKLFTLWNPPLRLKTVRKRTKTSLMDRTSVAKNVVTGRSSPILEVSYLLGEMVQHGLRCIAFCRTRKICELVLCHTREVLQQTAPHLVNKIYAYRAGYIAEDRRRIESGLFSGSICGIAATNALELGIDVGHIDVTLHLGFPGSIASLWQQAGRSGRREKPSLAIYVAFEGPLDQYFMKSPHKLFTGSIECCHVDAKNEQVLQQHLSCAALEYPLSLLHDEKYFGPGLESAIMILQNKGCLSTDLSRDCAARIWTYIGQEKSPSSVVNVRAIETIRFKVIDQIKNEVLEEIEESKAFFQVYEGAVYMNQGKTFLVKHLDLSSKIAWCQAADVNYYTRVRDFTDIHVTGSHVAYPVITNDQFAKTTAQTHICKVTTRWFGFYRVWRRSNQVFDTVELSLPDYSYESQAVWIRVPESLKSAVETSQYSFRGGLHAAGHALLNVLPLFIICNQSDLASECANPHDNRYVPERILLYDLHPGGTGISAKVQPLFTELLTSALELLTSCHCSEVAGCPNCVQNLSCHEYNEVLHKDAALMIIKGVLDAERYILKKPEA